MSSSNRKVPQCDGVLIEEGRPRGPIRLPDHRADDFIAAFNRTYEELGMEVAEQEKPPATRRSKDNT